MTFEEAFNEYERLKAAYEAGDMDAAAFDTAVSRLQVVGQDGRHWRIGALTGDWYRAEGGVWVPDNPQRPTPPPSVPPILRLFLPGITAMACLILVYIGIAGVSPVRAPGEQRSRPCSRSGNAGCRSIHPHADPHANSHIPANRDAHAHDHGNAFAHAHAYAHPLAHTDAASDPDVGGPGRPLVGHIQRARSLGLGSKWHGSDPGGVGFHH